VVASAEAKAEDAASKVVKLDSSERSRRNRRFAAPERGQRQEFPCPSFQFQEMFRHGEDTTPYRKLSSISSAHQSSRRDVLTVEPEALTALTAAAFHDISHLLRPGHLAQLASILDDPEASSTTSTWRSSF